MGRVRDAVRHGRVDAVVLRHRRHPDQRQRETVSLLNPYPTDAVVDLSFTTDQGVEQPQGFQGLVVPPGGLLTVNLGDHLRRRQAIATTVTARSGRLVAWKTEVVTPPTRQEACSGTAGRFRPARRSGRADCRGHRHPGRAAHRHWPGPGRTAIAGNGVNEQLCDLQPRRRTRPS